MFDKRAEKIKSSLLKLAPDIFGNPSVLFAYLYGSYATGLVHPFSDLDIGIYVDRLAPHKPRPLGRGQGELSENVYHPYREAPTFRAGRLNKMSRRQCLELELSLALEIDEKLGSGVSSEVRIINNLPLVVTGKIITEGILIFSRNEAIRVDFETSLRGAYFDFVPVLRRYQSVYMQSIVS
ncbi:MAG: nucleotidyltransferase domain-containing protein [Desulfobacterales bacterium]|nr:nucleotidyltransferase domain-containing protein [Desulfobacterales bacterium]